ncbi:hypothetical protein HMPREF1981_03343 [Bacteroides pyogenes F0041]|uniref:Uncharacterized protein n=1 Tax=Bacteroides pyogenes F0041 TaxID=1321819 RepID=U2CAV0_9BACE|nr:hypothetical protein HMPREF1981_03343 [Bacteroides pyogenes F0041]
MQQPERFLTLPALIVYALFQSHLQQPERFLILSAPLFLSN